MGSDDLKKFQTPPTFPKLGVTAVHSPTPVVTTEQQLQNKVRGGYASMKGPNADRNVAIDAARDKTLATPPIGVRFETAKGSQAGGYVMSNDLRAKLKPFHPPGEKSDLATVQHENFHDIMQQVGKKYGETARQALAEHITDEVGSHPGHGGVFNWFKREHVGQVYNPNGALFNEEVIAKLHNYLNDADDRGKVGRIHFNGEVPRHVDAKLKAAWKHIQQVAATAGPEVWQGHGQLRTEPMFPDAKKAEARISIRRPNGQFSHTSSSKRCTCGKTLGEHRLAFPHKAKGCKGFEPELRKDEELETPEVSLILVSDGSGRYLFGKRNDDGKYTLPGGHLEPGEVAEEGAHRELFEETGLQALSLTPLKTVEPTAPGRARLHFFTALCSGTPTNHHDPDAEGEFKWVDCRGGLPKNIWDNLHGPPGDANLLRQVFDLRRSEAEWLDWGALVKAEGATGTFFDGVPCMYDSADDCPDIDCTHHTEVKKAEVNPVFRGEVASLLRHPDPVERAMALKLSSVTPADIATAILDPDPYVWRQAMQHPLAAHALEVLSSSTRDAAGNPLFDRHDELLNSGRATGRHRRQMLDATQNDVDLPMEARAARIVALHPWLGDLEKHEGHDSIHAGSAPSTPANAAKEETLPHLKHIEAAYHAHVASNPDLKPINQNHGSYEGLSPKAIYEVNVDGHHTPQKLMVKPYAESRHPLSGWSELTNQALYHAANIGHLHQSAFVAPHGDGKTMVPGVVIHIENAKTLHNVPLSDHHPENFRDCHRIALMDFLSDNPDRHTSNIMVRNGSRRLLAIDHGLNFNYPRNGAALSRHAYEVPAYLGETTSYDDPAHPGMVDALKWWGEVGPDVRHAFKKRLELLNDEQSERDLISGRTNKEHLAHIASGFKSRADHLDLLAAKAKRGEDIITAQDLRRRIYNKPEQTFPELFDTAGVGHAMQKALGNAGFVNRGPGNFPVDKHDVATGLKAAHPMSLQPHVDHFEQNLNQHAQEHKPVLSSAGMGDLGGPEPEIGGVEPKAVYEHAGKRYLVKPLLSNNMPLSGWNEMTSQAMYHAGNIGHLHQKVHVTDVQHTAYRPAQEGDTDVEPANPGWGKLATPMAKVKASAPAQVIHMEPNARVLDDDLRRTEGAYVEKYQNNPAAQHAMRQIALMDFLTSNADRHEGNLMLHPDGMPLAIDHGLAFGHDHDVALNPERDATDQEALFGMGPRDSAAFSYGGTPEQHEEWAPVWEWWDTHKDDIKDAFESQAALIPDKNYRTRLLDSYRFRHNYLDNVRNQAPDAYSHQGVDDMPFNGVSAWLRGE